MRYRINDKKFFVDITDGIAIIIDVETGVYYGLNDLTTNIFENIISGVDSEEIFTRLQEIKGYDSETEKKYRLFLTELVNRECIVESETEMNEMHISVDEFSDDELDLVISEFRDVTEMLLADPIHHVKEDKGWKPNII